MCRYRNVVAEIDGVAGDESQPPQPGQRREQGQQVAEPHRAAAPLPAIAVDGLAQQRDLGSPGIDQAADLVPDVGGVAADLGAANEGHDAVRTELVAPARDPHHGLRGRRGQTDVARHVQVFQALVGPKVARSRPRRVQPRDVLRTPGNLLDHRRQRFQLTRRADQVHLRVLLEQPLALPLGQAAQHADDDLSSAGLSLALRPQARVDLVFRLPPHAAGVVEHHVGGAVVANHVVPGRAQRRCDQLAVQPVHLATHGLQVDFHGRNFLLYPTDFQFPNGIHHRGHGDRRVRRKIQTTKKLRRGGKSQRPSGTAKKNATNITRGAALW
jgi:hypothetical protein